MATTFGNEQATQKSGGSERDSRFKAVDPKVKHFVPDQPVAFGPAYSKTPVTVGQPPMQGVQPPIVQPDKAQIPAPQPGFVVQPPQAQVPQQPPIPSDIVEAVKMQLAHVGKNIHDPISWSEVQSAELQQRIPAEWTQLNGYRKAVENCLDSLISNSGKQGVSGLLDKVFVLLFFIRDEVEIRLKAIPIYYEMASTLVETIYRISWRVQEKLVQTEGDHATILHRLIVAWGLLLQLNTIMHGTARREGTDVEAELQQPDIQQVMQQLHALVEPQPKMISQIPPNMPNGGAGNGLPPLPQFPAG